ncbi:MAG: hypothetical protein V4717_05580 [Bacteroidota bacterium]
MLVSPGTDDWENTSVRIKIGGGYEMHLYYQGVDSKSIGKTRKNEDRFRTRFIELIPGKKIVEAINFELLITRFQAK